MADPAGKGPSHRHRQYAQKLVKIARVVPETDRQTHRHAHYNTSQPLPRSK